MKNNLLKQSGWAAIALLITISLLQVSVSQAAGKVSVETAAAIQAQNASYMAAFGRGDAAALAELHSKDGTVLPPRKKPVRGREAIRNLLAEDFSKGTAVLTLTTSDLRQFGEMVYETGSHQVRVNADEDSEVLEEGSYLVIWKRSEEGVWQLHVDIWNLK